jgi:hypothetical protein
MSRLSNALIAAVALLGGMVGTADAFYCGAARWAACRSPEPQQCCTIMKTCQQTVYEEKLYTCYRTCYQPIWEYKVVSGVRNVPQTHYRDCIQIITRPVYKEVVRQVPCLISRPVEETRTIKICTGHWETQNMVCCEPDPKDPSAKPVKKIQQCRVWKLEMVEKQVPYTRFVTETVMSKDTHWEQVIETDRVVHRIPYTVIVQQEFQSTVPCVRYEARQVPFTYTRMEPRVVTVQVPVQVCCPVPSCGGK